MDLLLNNSYILIPGILIFLIAIFNGLRTSKFLKFLIAAFNLLGLFLLIIGTYYVINNRYFNTYGDTVPKEITETKEILNANFLSTPNFENDNTNFFHTANVYLDFSGSVKPEELLSRIQSIALTLEIIPHKNFYYFGSCMGRIENPEQLSLDVIKTFQDSSCTDNGKKLKSNTDLFEVLTQVNSTLEHTANDKTLCLFITDDEHSTSYKTVNIQQEIQRLKPELQKFQQEGVVFQLIKIKGNTANKIMSSNELSSVFAVDEVSNDQLNQQLETIFKNRQIQNDLKPIQIDSNKLSNNKLLFSFKNLNIIDGKKDIEITIENNFKSFKPIVKIDSLVSENWKANIEKTDIGDPFFYLEKLENQRTIRLNFQLKKALQFLNTKKEEPIKTYYTVLVPGSQQYNVKKIFENHSAFTPISNQEITNGTYAASFYSKRTVENDYKITPWLYLVYGIALFLIAKLIALGLSPTLKGRTIQIRRTDVNNYKVEKKIKSTIAKYSIKDLNQLEAFIFEAKKVKRSKFNILSQPFDNIHFTSKYISLKNNKGNWVNTVLVLKKWQSNDNNHQITIR